MKMHWCAEAEFAVAAQQAAMREAEEASLPPEASRGLGRTPPVTFRVFEALPGVYAGHLESPRSILLPRTPKVANA